MRLFVAAPVPGGEALRQLALDLKNRHPGARLVPDGTWHVTLRFLGDVDDDQAGAVGDALATALEGVAAVPVRLEGAGAFPKPSAARVAWAGSDAPGLDDIAARVVDATRAFGQPPDKRRFVPHVTLARFQPPRDLRDWIDAHRGKVLAEGIIDRIVLFRSQLGPQGPTYGHMREVVLPPVGGVGVDQTPSP